MEAAAQARAERLKAMRAAAQGDDGADEEVRHASKRQRSDNGPVLKFRNYTPQDETLVDEQEEVTLLDMEKELESKIEAEADTFNDMNKQLDISSLAPRKPDWDLKRAVAKKLDKLERRTQRAIVELIKERHGDS